MRFVLVHLWQSWLSGRATQPYNNAITTIAGRDEYDPAIVSDGSGGAIISWHDSRSAVSWDIYAQMVNVNGYVQWTTNGVPVCTESGHHQWSTAIASNGSGGAIIAWVDYRNGNADLYAQFINASGGAEWATDGIPICTTLGEQRMHQVISDGSGGIIIAWRDYRSGSDFDIYAQRVNANGVAQWSPDGVPVCTASGNQDRPRLVSDGSGGAIMTWRDNRSGLLSDVYAQRVNASGVLQWTTNGVPICAASGDQGDPNIVNDGSGGAIITWWDKRGVNSDIYAQRIDASGTVQWMTCGVIICAASRVQAQPDLVTDGSGGAIITWWDYRNGADCDIYAQRVSTNGVVQWTADGIPICTESNDQELFDIASDASGGAIVVWEDHRYDESIYGQRVNSSGITQWTTNGVPITTKSCYKQAHTAVSDGSGGLIATWMDNRNPGYDIYAQKVNADGTIGFVVTSHSPTQNQLAVAKNIDIQVEFNLDVDPSTINANTFVVHASQTGLHTGMYSYDSGTKTATLNPTKDFAVGERVTVTLTAGIQTTTGAPLSNTYEYSINIDVDGGSGTFQAKTDYTTGSGPESVYSADIDGDGDMDLAVTNGVSNTISIFKNNGDGTFAAKIDYITETNPNLIYSSDFDGDGDMDLAVTNVSPSNTVSIFNNNSDGTFATRTEYTSGTNPVGVNSADFDGDGYMDLAVTNNNSNTVSVFKNNGDGTFVAKTDYTTGTNPLSVYSADFDGDGDMDLAVANNNNISANTVSILMNISGDNTPPTDINDLSVGSVTATSVTLTWTAPGDDTTSGTASTYNIRYSTSTITEANWALADTATGEPAPQVAGSAETFTVSGLSAFTTYYFAIKTSDEVPNQSGISNIASTTTNSLHDDPGYAINLDGSDYVHIPQDVVLQTRNSMTIEAWIRCVDPTRDQQIFNEHNGYYNRIELSLRNNAGVRFAHEDKMFDTGSSVISANQWTHIAGVYDSGTGTGKIYINGSLVSSTENSVGTTTNNYDVAIGSFSNGAFPGYKFNGEIDEVRHWNVARTAAQIQASYNHCVDKSEPNLVGYWEFDSNAADSTSNANNGTLMGDPTFIWSTAPFGTDNTVPSAVADLNISRVTGDSVTLVWSAPGDDGSTGTATTYDIRYSTFSIDASNWDTATQATGEPSPQAAGSTETFTVAGLSQNTTYYFAIKTADEVPNWSGLSNVVNGKTGTAVSGNVSGTWTLAGSPYIAVGMITIPDGQILSIDPGVRVKFNNSTGFNIEGKLVSQGTSSQHITFTSANSSPSAGVWVGLFFNDCDAGTMLEFCDISYGGNGYTWGGGIVGNQYGCVTIKNGGSNLTIANCTISNSQYDGIYVEANASPDIHDCTAENNARHGIHCGSPSSDPAIADCSISNNGEYAVILYANTVPSLTGTNSIVGNGTNAIGVNSEDITTGTWMNHNVPYHIISMLSVSLKIPDGEILTLNPGVELDFDDNYGMLIEGKLVAQGTSSDHITFSSSNSSPTAGIWVGIFFYYCDVGSILEYCDISYGGNGFTWGGGSMGNQYGCININHCSDNLTIEDCSISNSQYDGISIHSNSSPMVINCTIQNNNRYGIHFINNSSNQTVRNCDIENNTQYGIYHSGSGLVDAEHNWWGDSSGPLDDSDDTSSGGLYNPTGTGDRVTDGIDYDPWDRKDTESISITGTYNFNESSEGGNGHDINMNFSNITGSGDITVRQTDDQPSDAPCFNVCGHYWAIEKDAGITAFSADITFHYIDADVTGYTESAAFFGIAKFNSSTNTWQWLGGTVDAANNKVTVSGVTSFSTFALFRRIFGDITGYGYVDAADLQRLGDCWHQTNSEEFTAGSDARFFNYNKNTDGGNQIIDAADLQVFGDCWHNGVEL